MGCWNKTCGLSNLYIQHTEPVYTFILTQNGSEGRCYNTSFYTPVLVPFECTYDDYGAGENAHGVALKPLMDTIQKIRVKDEKYIEEFTVETFFELTHDGLLHKNFWGDERLIDFVMMRKDVVDYVLDNWVREEYVGVAHSPNGYINYKYADVIAAIPEFIDLLDEKIQAHHKIDGGKRGPMYNIFALNYRRGFSALIESNTLQSLVVLALRHDIDQVFNTNEYLIHLVADEKREEAVEFLTMYIKGAFINSLLDSTRKQWLPGCHDGSQACDHDGYRILMEATTKVLDEMETEDDEV